MYFLARFGEEQRKVTSGARPALSAHKKENLDVAEFMHSHFEVIAENAKEENGPNTSIPGSLSQIEETGEGETLLSVLLCIFCGTSVLCLVLTLSRWPMIANRNNRIHARRRSKEGP